MTKLKSPESNVQSPKPEKKFCQADGDEWIEPEKFRRPVSSVQSPQPGAADDMDEQFELFLSRGLSAQQAADAAIRRFEPQHRGAR